MEKKFDKHKLSFPVTFEKIDEIKSGDTRFTKLKCWLMHTNENYNHSSFSKEVIEDALPTLAYIPVVGFIENDEFGEEDFSDHRYIITKDNGKVKRVYMGSAYGVILSSEDNNAHFEKKICDDGIEREFIVANAVAWNFLEDSSRILNRDLIKDHSIELDENSIEGYEDEKTGIFHFTKFSFRAACVLGGSSRPAMEGSVVEVVNFSMNDFARDVQSELINKYSEFTKLVNDTTNQDFTSLNMVDEKFNGGVENMEKNDFAQTILAQFSDISTLVSQHEKFTDRFGDEYPRYYTVDIQENEVIVVDAMNNYNYFAFSFTMNGDKPEIDFEKPKRKKVCYEDYVEGETVPEGAFDFGKHIAKIEDNAFTKVEEANVKVSEAENKVSEYETKVSEFETAKNEIEEKFNQVNAEFEEMKPKYEDYVRAEQARIEAELDAQKDTEFAKYETVLVDDVNFAALKEKKAELTVKEIESECAILYARKNLANTNFSKSDNGIMTAGIIHDNSNDGFVETKYGCIPVRH